MCTCAGVHTCAHTHTHLVYAHVRYIFPLRRRSTVWLPIGEAAGRWSSEHGSARNHLSILRTIQVQSDMQLMFGCRSSNLARVQPATVYQLSVTVAQLARWFLLSLALYTPRRRHYRRRVSVVVFVVLFRSHFCSRTRVVAGVRVMQR